MEFDPFKSPLRARQEEFGDVLAEGLVNLLHDGRATAVGQFPAYWLPVLTQRSAMLARLRTDLAERGASRAVAASLEASQGRLAELTPESLGEFVALWYRDLYRWNARLNWLPRLTSLRDALAWLGLRNVHVNP